LIISASRRTDIPALYGEWFINRIKAGYVLTRNPMDPLQITKVSLLPEDVDAIVFWTKNPLPFIKYLKELQNYNYYFQFTITAYDNSIEKNLPAKEKVIETFCHLSSIIGEKKVIWRYDPIFWIGKYDLDTHVKNFSYIAKKLKGYTNRCMISFLTEYNKCKKNINMPFKRPEEEEIIKLAEEISPIALDNNIKLQTCAEEIDLSLYNIEKGSCIDKKLISELIQKEIFIAKDKNQRKSCNCCASIDIGAYNSCTNGCIYCYANSNFEIAKKNLSLHDANSSLLIGQITGKEIIKEIPQRTNQLELF